MRDWARTRGEHAFGSPTAGDSGHVTLQDHEILNKSNPCSPTYTVLTYIDSHFRLIIATSKEGGSGDDGWHRMSVLKHGRLKELFSRADVRCRAPADKFFVVAFHGFFPTANPPKAYVLRGRNEIEHGIVEMSERKYQPRALRRRHQTKHSFRNKIWS